MYELLLELHALTQAIRPYPLLYVIIGMELVWLVWFWPDHFFGNLNEIEHI